MNRIGDIDTISLKTDLKYISKFIKPTYKMKFKKYLSNRINPYSQFRLNNNISLSNIYLLKCLNKLFNKKYRKRLI